MMSARVRQLVVIGAMLLALPVVAHGQEATIIGTVTDATGAVLPGVTVTAVHEATGNRFTSVTDALGKYQIPARIGTYQITAELRGFTTVERTGVTLLVGQTVAINMQMTVSTVSETVTVTGESPLIDISSSASRRQYRSKADGRAAGARAQLGDRSRCWRRGTGRPPWAPVSRYRTETTARFASSSSIWTDSKSHRTWGRETSRCTAAIRSRSFSSSRTGSMPRRGALRACR